MKNKEKNNKIKKTINGYDGMRRHEKYPYELSKMKMRKELAPYLFAGTLFLIAFTLMFVLVLLG